MMTESKKVKKIKKIDDDDCQERKLKKKMSAMRVRGRESDEERDKKE